MAFNSRVQGLFNQQSQGANKGIFDLVGSGQVGMQDVADTIGQDKVDWYMKQNGLAMPAGGGLATQGLSVPQNFSQTPSQSPAPEGNFGINQFTPTTTDSNFNPTKYPTAIPAAPSFVAAATDQGNANLSAAKNTVALSNPDVKNTYGSQTMTTGPDGRPVLNQNLSPDMQERLDALNPMLKDGAGRIKSELSNDLRSYITQQLGAPSYDSLSKISTQGNMSGHQDIYNQLRGKLPQGENFTELNQNLAGPKGLENLYNGIRQRLPQGSNLSDINIPTTMAGLDLFNEKIRGRLPSADPNDLPALSTQRGMEGFENLYNSMRGKIPDTSNASLTARTVKPSVASQEMVTNAMREREAPRMTRDRTQIENDLKIKGINPGTEAWNNAIMDVDRKENDFQLGLLAMSGQEQDRRFGLESKQRAQESSELNDYYNREMGVGQFAGDTQSRLFGMDTYARELADRETGNQFNRELSAGQFAGDTQSRLFGLQSSQRGQQEQELNNLFSRELGVGNYATGVQSQLFNQNLGTRDQQRSELNDQFSREMGVNQFAGDTQSRLFDLESGLRGQQRSEVNDLYGLQSSRRNQQTSEAQLLRGQPIQEYAALIQAMQPQLPQFQSYTGATVDAAPYFTAANARGLFDLDRYGTMIQGELGTRGVDASKSNANKAALADLVGAGIAVI